ncbi:MAG: efflux RND transporter periplasmic adaptor subunit [Myxococcota bacterium]
MEHAGDHGGEESDHDGPIRLSEAERTEFGIELEEAGPGQIALTIELPGEVRPNQDRLAHLVPRFSGIVKEVRKQIGDPVKAGEVLALIESSESLASYPLKSLIAGTVIAKHITRGEAVSTESEAFVVADLSSVWVDLSVYQKDLDRLRVGQPVSIATGHAAPAAEGTISYLAPVVDEQTRTATARVVLPNPEGTWRPGLFVTGTVTVDRADVPVSIPRDAVQTLGDQTVVFVLDSDGLEPRPVRLGRSDRWRLQILDGLSPGDRFVSRGAFTLKSELEKAGFEAGHGH